MRGGSADWVGGVGADHEIDVGAIRAKRVVARQIQLGAGPPPAVPCRDNAICQARFQLRPPRTRGVAIASQSPSRITSSIAMRPQMPASKGIT